MLKLKLQQRNGSIALIISQSAKSIKSGKTIQVGSIRNKNRNTKQIFLNKYLFIYYIGLGAVATPAAQKWVDFIIKLPEYKNIKILI